MEADPVVNPSVAETVTVVGDVMGLGPATPGTARVAVIVLSAMESVTAELLEATPNVAPVAPP